MKAIIICPVLFIFSFSLQSFSGIQIEKRHYRKGYYIHICHAPKTHPVYTVASKEEVMTNVAPVAQKEEPVRAIDNPGRKAEINAPAGNIAPVSQAPRLKN